MSIYSDLSLEAVTQRKLERKLERYYWRCDTDIRPLVWSDMADAHDQMRYCQYLLCQPEQLGQPSVSY